MSSMIKYILSSLLILIIGFLIYSFNKFDERIPEVIKPIDTIEDFTVDDSLNTTKKLIENICNYDDIPDGNIDVSLFLNTDNIALKLYYKNENFKLDSIQKYINDVLLTNFNDSNDSIKTINSNLYNSVIFLKENGILITKIKLNEKF